MASISASEETKTLFFNYHEFSETYYADLDTPTQPREHDESEALIITHFPNVYTPQTSQLFRETRIVRIPCRFEQNVYHPCFSECLPGLEPAAITGNEDGKEGEYGFVPRGIYDNEVFGITSTSPLSLCLTPEQFQTIMHEVNALIEQEFQVNSWQNIINLCLGILTLGIWTWINTTWQRHTRNNLDLHIEQLNESQLLASHRIKIINPRQSGYLSLDFQIPRPIA
ncbi:ras modification protein erf4 [Maudiozyma exigua]|uniref:Ras modification protein ERF4 n=1 Tax=Maudiozyma exigua TaxID=34358 RepID=A0A9P6WEN5_MAUEX|nr:ras modification protein erf4 [Kazachstania exigua]